MSSPCILPIICVRQLRLPSSDGNNNTVLFASGNCVSITTNSSKRNIFHIPVVPEAVTLYGVEALVSDRNGMVYVVAYGEDFITLLGGTTQESISKLWSHCICSRDWIMAVALCLDGDDCLRIWVLTRRGHVFAFNNNFEQPDLVLVFGDHPTMHFGILSTGTITAVPQGFISAAGTFFGEIILYDGSGKTCSLKNGHVGRIERVKFVTSKEERKLYLLSTADDRSAILWDIDPTFLSATHVRKFSNGHGSRLWDVDYVVDIGVIVTGGEDGRVVLWNCSTGDIQYEYEVHTGHGCTTLEANHDGIVTGGYDGGVRYIHKPFTSVTHTPEENSSYALPVGSLRAMTCFVDSGKGCRIVYAANHRGDVYKFSCTDTIATSTTECIVVGNKTDVREGPLITTMHYCTSQQQLYLGDSTGYVTVIKDSTVVTRFQAIPTKVSILSGNGHVLIAGNPFGVLQGYDILSGQYESTFVVSDHTQPITAVALKDSTLVMGDKKGTILSYNVHSATTEKSAEFRKVHQGKINEIVFIGGGDIVATCGGNEAVIGMFRRSGGVWYHMTSIQLCNRLTSVLYYSPTVIVGMHGDTLHILSAQDFTIMASHKISTTRRSLQWAVEGNGSEDGNDVKYVVACASGPCDIKVQTDNIRKGFTSTIQNGLHGHDIHCISALECKGATFVFCGSEDTSVSLSVVHKDRIERKSIGHAHCSGVRSCCLFADMERKLYAVSGGGMERVVLWSVDDTSSLTLQVMHELGLSSTTDLQFRVLALAVSQKDETTWWVFAGTSGGIIHKIEFLTTSSIYLPKLSSSCATVKLQQDLRFGPIFSAATTGLLYGVAGTSMGKLCVFNQTDLVVVRTIDAHQGPVTALSLDSSDVVLFIASGSDDQSVQYWELPIGPGVDVTVVRYCVCFSGQHSAAVRGISFQKERVISYGADKISCEFQIISPGGSKLVKQTSLRVAHVQGIATTSTSAFLAGQGIVVTEQ